MDLNHREPERRRMVIEQIEARGIRSPEVLAAFSKVPRHDFVPQNLQSLAYGDGALAIGWGQTISQPYIVALMSEWLWTTGPHEKVLEIGTGSGYQAAILAEMGVQVYSLDILPQITQQAQINLNHSGYGSRVTLKTADGFSGWPEAAPFDAVIIACAVPEIPLPLAGQLAPQGRIIAPVGETLARQTLTLAEPRPGGGWRTQPILDVVFVPMTGPNGF